MNTVLQILVAPLTRGCRTPAGNKHSVSKQIFSACIHAACYFLIVWYASSHRIAYGKGNTDIRSAKTSVSCPVQTPQRLTVATVARTLPLPGAKQTI